MHSFIDGSSVYPRKLALVEFTSFRKCTIFNIIELHMCFIDFIKPCV